MNGDNSRVVYANFRGTAQDGRDRLKYIAGGSGAQHEFFSSYHASAERAAPYITSAGGVAMADFTRGEFEARLEAAEARTGGKLSSMDAKLDLLMQRLGDVQSTANDAKNAAVSVKWNIFFGVLGILGTIGLLLAFGLQAFEAAVAVFQAGQS